MRLDDLHLWFLGDPAAPRDLFRRMVFNILIDNTDGHEKNHALLVVNPEGNGRLKLAAAYDVWPSAGISTRPGVRLRR